jgi:hypothetical protein
LVDHAIEFRRQSLGDVANCLGPQELGAQAGEQCSVRHLGADRHPVRAHILTVFPRTDAAVSGRSLATADSGHGTSADATAQKPGKEMAGIQRCVFATDERCTTLQAEDSAYFGSARLRAIPQLLGNNPQLWAFLDVPLIAGRGAHDALARPGASCRRLAAPDEQPAILLRLKHSPYCACAPASTPWTRAPFTVQPNHDGFDADTSGVELKDVPNRVSVARADFHSLSEQPRAAVGVALARWIRNADRPVAERDRSSRKTP